MISHLKGSVVSNDLKSIILSVQGVGYKVHTTLEVIEKNKNKGVVELWTYLAVRENALDLYGFEEKEEKDVFELLITLPGIGPKSALAVLNLVPHKTLLKAISSNEVDYLTKVSGIGRKTAEKIISGLRDKVDQGDGASSFSKDGDVLEALKSLGYGDRDIRDILKKIPSSITETGERVREALKILSGK